VPGLCVAWNAASDFRTWTFRCRHALEIAAELRRVGRLRASPANWIFAELQHVAVPSPGHLVVRLRIAWRRFPYALTTVAAAPRRVPGPFRLVASSRTRIVARSSGVTLVFLRLAPPAAELAFLRGKVDEAPVPLGDVSRFGGSLPIVHVRPLLALDAVVFRGSSVPLDVRRAYWQTADRTDYQALVVEQGASTALGVGGTTERADPGAFRRALHSIPSLPPLPVRIAVPDSPTLRYGARILYAQWREVGLGPRLVAQQGLADADFERALAVYPQQEALLGALGLKTALGDNDQHAAFASVGARLRRDATVVPICWVADARLVSPRLSGWHEDVLGDVDYGVLR
jgi:hypothetical protein